jgi:hypothetical protein
MQKSHFATTLPCLSILIAPYGQTMMHVQQPMHLSLLCVIRLVFGSFCMAPARQAVTHGASSQWRHCMAKEMGLFISKRTRLIGLGCSLLYALIGSFDLECCTVQATSHNPQPMQFSCLAIILFKLNSSLNKFWFSVDN